MTGKDPQPADRPLVAPSPLPGLYADPALAVFGDRYWLYPTTDGSEGWAATSFRAFSSPDLVDWTDHGEVLRLGDNVTWSDRKAWAPAIAKRAGIYYLYFSADENIGVARSHRPDGPYEDLGRPLVARGAFSGTAIDPSAFRDDDGTWYLLWGNGVAHLAPLGPDMMSFERDAVVDWVPTGFREAITIHRRGELYYASWSENDTREHDYRVRYATSTSLRGPWRDRGVLIEQDAALGYLATGHHSVVRVGEGDEWIVAYHRFALKAGSGYRRETVFDPLLHHPNGTLEVVRHPGGYRRPL